MAFDTMRERLLSFINALNLFEAEQRR